MKITWLRLWTVCAFSVVIARADLRVTVDHKVTVFTEEQLAALPRIELSLDDPHEKKLHRYSGFAVRELLDRVGAPLGEKLRGAALQLGVLVKAKDGYSVLFSLADFDDAFSARTLILADQIDGQPLPEKSAPRQLVASGDKRAGRWVRMVTSLEVAALPVTP